MEQRGSCGVGAAQHHMILSEWLANASVRIGAMEARCKHFVETTEAALHTTCDVEKATPAG